MAPKDGYVNNKQRKYHCSINKKKKETHNKHYFPAAGMGFCATSLQYALFEELFLGQTQLFTYIEVGKTWASFTRGQRSSTISSTLK